MTVPVQEIIGWAWFSRGCFALQSQGPMFGLEKRLPNLSHSSRALWGSRLRARALGLQLSPSARDIGWPWAKHCLFWHLSLTFTHSGLLCQFVHQVLCGHFSASALIFSYRQPNPIANHNKLLVCPPSDLASLMLAHPLDLGLAVTSSGKPSQFPLL